MPYLQIETGLAVLALMLALTAPNLGSRWFEAIERSFGKLARRRGLSVIVVGLTALALRAALLPIAPVPPPIIGDEFAYLLGADTFAHGRLANLTPAMWNHFESLMILLRPTYASRYPPAQSLILAAGQVLMGHPFWGVWLSVGLMCAAITWMLQAWIGEGWALLGGFLAVARVGAFSYWADSYWGGAVAALGGALALGALPRIKQEHRVRNALLMGLGLAILANSRPYEGLVFSLPIAAALFVWMLGRNRPPFSISLRQVVLPLCLLLGLTAAWMGYYNWRVTGNPLRMPYQVYQAQYDPTPHFLWEAERPLPSYRHPIMKEWETDFALHNFTTAKSHPARWELVNAALIWLFFGGPLFTLLIIVAFFTLPYGSSWKDISGQSRFLLLVFAVSLAGIAVEVFFYPHYAAPMTCLFLALLLLVMRRLTAWRSERKPRGLFLVRCVPLITLLILVLRCVVSPPHTDAKINQLVMWTSWISFRDRFSTSGRGAILSDMQEQSNGQLVLVRYTPQLYDKALHTSALWPPLGVGEWVYNSADIDSQKVIWAHDMGPEQNAELIRYYKNRRVWLLYADEQPPKLVPYSEAADAQAQASAQKGP